MTTNVRYVTCAIAAALAGACGAGSGDWFPSDVDEDATIDRAGDAAVAKVCSAFEDFLYDQYRGSLLVEVACTARGIEQTTDSAACGDFVQDCIDNPPAEVDSTVSSILAQSGCSAVMYESMGCSKTISDLKACLDAIDAEVASLKYDVVCAAAGQPLPPNALTIETPAVCLEIENECPTL
jgi:hypothetical protein